MTQSTRERRTYNPEYHARHKTKYTLAERVYIARYYDVDGESLMSAALERPKYNISAIVQIMRRNGEWELYRSLTEEEYEKIIMAGDRSNEKSL